MGPEATLKEGQAVNRVRYYLSFVKRFLAVTACALLGHVGVVHDHNDGSACLLCLRCDYQLADLTVDAR